MHRFTFPALILAIAFVACSGCMGFMMKGEAPPTTVETPLPATTVATTTLPVMTTAEETTVAPDLYPGALKLKEAFNYSSGTTASQGTVYRYWLNDTYQLYNPSETRYSTKYPSLGNRFLILFINTVNRGSARNLALKTSNIMVHYNENTYYPDPTHTLPKTEANTDSPAEVFRIREIEFFHKLYGSEYVEDFGYSHGMVQAYLTPGESNAIDGYIVYQVPKDIDPSVTYVEIPFNSQDVAVWKLV